MARRARPKGEIVQALQDVVARRAAEDEALDVDAILDDMGRELGTVFVRSTYEPERVASPFAAPDGFHFPWVRPRRMTRRRRDTLIAQLAGAGRREDRRLAVSFLGSALDDPEAVAALRAASRDDPDPYVRGESLMCLGLSGAEPVENLVDGAQRLVREASQMKTGTTAYDVAREGAAYAIMGALLAATREGRADLAEGLAVAAGSLGTQMTVDHSSLPARQRRALLRQIAVLGGEGAPPDSRAPAGPAASARQTRKRSRRSHR